MTALDFDLSHDRHTSKNLHRQICFNLGLYHLTEPLACPVQDHTFDQMPLVKLEKSCDQRNQGTSGLYSLACT